VNELFQTLLHLPEQSSSLAYELDVFHYIVITVSVLGAAGVALAVLVFLFRFRERPGRTDRPHVARIPLSVELGAIGGLLALFFVFWIIGYRQFVRLRTPPAGALEVYVVAKQWMWSFAYPDGGATIHDLYVPAGRPVKLVMTSRDVIHSFFVPDFRIKQDVVPGQMTTTWFEALRPGEYEILCTEYCGAQHSYMRGRVIVLDDADYARWAERRGPEHDLASYGERIAAERGCLRCHTVDGTPHLGPTWAGVYGATIPLANGDEIVVDEAYLTESMMDPQAKVRAGFATIMPSYRGLIAGADVAAIVEYIRSLADRPLDPQAPPIQSTPIAIEPGEPLP
jgi:cytochrome c oxidase subunit 2